MYAGHLCKHAASYDMNFKTAYNNVCRAVMDLNRDSSMPTSYSDYNVHCFSHLFRSYIAGFIDRLLRIVTI